MDLLEAIDKLREQDLVVRQIGSDQLILGGERIEVHDDIELIKGNNFGIHFEAGWWIAGFPAFGTNPISQITDNLGIAVQSLLSVIQYDRQKAKDYQGKLIYTLADLQNAHLPVLVTDYGVLEIYQPPNEPKGLRGIYGNFLTDWWLPTDSPATPIGKMLLKNGAWFIEAHDKNESIAANTLEVATQKALELFK